MADCGPTGAAAVDPKRKFATQESGRSTVEVTSRFSVSGVTEMLGAAACDYVRLGSKLAVSDILRELLRNLYRFRL